MLTFDRIYSKRDSIEKIRQGYLKDISSIDILKNEELAAQIRIRIIMHNDVYLPITDDCYVKIFTNGSYEMTDVNLLSLSYNERHTRTALINNIISKIMSCIEKDPKN